MSEDYLFPLIMFVLIVIFAAGGGLVSSCTEEMKARRIHEQEMARIAASQPAKVEQAK